MKKNIHIVNADRLARLIGLAANPRVKSTLVKAWANEIRLACRLAEKGGV